MIQDDKWLNKSSGKSIDLLIMSQTQRRMIENGNHPFLRKNFSKDIQRKRIEDGTHHFIGGEIQRKRVANGTHNFLGGEIQHRMISNGTHPFLTKITCQYCNKSIDKGNFSKHHRRKM